MKIENTIKIEEFFNTLFIYYYDNGIKKVEKIDVDNYIYVEKKDLVRVQECLSTFEYIISNKEFESIYHEKVIKIIPNRYQFWKIRKKLWENDIQTYEAKLSVYLKFLLNNEISFTILHIVQFFSFKATNSILFLF